MPSEPETPCSNPRTWSFIPTVLSDAPTASGCFSTLSFSPSFAERKVYRSPHLTTVTFVTYSKLYQHLVKPELSHDVNEDKLELS